MAYATLGVAYSNQTQDSLSNESLKKAFDLKERASERERLYISAHYYGEFVADVGKTIETYEQWKSTYPRDSIPRDNLTLAYQTVGQFDKALSNASEAISLDPKDSYAHQNLASAYERLNRFEEAKAILDKAEAQNVSLSGGVLFTRYDLAFLEHDDGGMQRIFEAAKGKSSEPILLLLRGQGEYSLGKAQTARKTFSDALNVSQKLGMKEFGASLRLFQREMEAEIGNSTGAQQAVADALAISKDRGTRGIAAQVLAQIGDAIGSEKLVADLGREFPTDTMGNSVWIPIARATTEVRRNNAAKAIALLESARPYEFGAAPGGCHYWPNYVRAEAFLKSRDGAKAAAEYQSILDHRGVQPTSPLYTLARLGLGRAYALQGDTAKARTAYQDFFGAWKDADPDIPILKQAKAEYAALK